MKKIIYYTTTALVISCGISQAQTCVPTPTCSSLGYTSSSSCTNGIKCPFGNYWNCTLANKITELEKKVEVNQSQGEVCEVGSIFYSDKSCYLTPQKGKTPIGIVIYIDGSGGGQAMALNSIGNYLWSTESVDIPDLQNYQYVSQIASSYKDLDSCSNTAKIMAAGNKRKYPAAWAAHEYSTEGTNEGDWCLPAAGIFYRYYIDKEKINAVFLRIGGTIIADETLAWASSEYNSRSAWRSSLIHNGGFANGLSISDKDESYEVRPVIEF